MDLFHSMGPTGCAPPLTWHLKLADSPWRTVAVLGSTVTTAAWPATAHKERTGNNTHKCKSTYMSNETVNL